MIQIHHARGGEADAAAALWMEVFGDDPAFQREFYRLCAPAGPLVLTEDGELRSMLALPELALVLADGRRLRAGYVYALATRPDCRGQGWAAMLLETAAGLARGRGLDCLLTVPAHPELFRFFAQSGFQPGFYVREAEAPPAPAPMEKIPPEEYAALRESLLAGRAHTVYNNRPRCFQRGLCPHPASGLYRLELPRGPGCAAVEDWPERPVVKELLCARSDTEQGAGACAALCGRPVRARTPAGPGEGEPFGAARWLEGTPASIQDLALDGWLGLAFD